MIFPIPGESHPILIYVHAIKHHCWYILFSYIIISPLKCHSLNIIFGWLKSPSLHRKWPKQMTPPRAFADPHQGPTWPRQGASNSGIDIGKMIGMKKYGKNYGKLGKTMKKTNYNVGKNARKWLENYGKLIDLNDSPKVFPRISGDYPIPPHPAPCKWLEKLVT